MRLRILASDQTHALEQILQLGARHWIVGQAIGFAGPEHMRFVLEHGHFVVERPKIVKETEPIEVLGAAADKRVAPPEVLESRVLDKMHCLKSSDALVFIHSPRILALRSALL